MFVISLLYCILHAALLGQIEGATGLYFIIGTHKTVWLQMIYETLGHMLKNLVQVQILIVSLYLKVSMEHTKQHATHYINTDPNFFPPKGSGATQACSFSFHKIELKTPKWQQQQQKRPFLFKTFNPL